MKPIDANLISKRELARNNETLSALAEAAHFEGAKFRAQRDVARALIGVALALGVLLGWMAKTKGWF